MGSGSLPALPSGDVTEKFKSMTSAEKVTAAIALLGLAALGLVFWGSIVGFLVAMIADTVHLVLLCVSLFAMLWVLFSKRSHLIVRVLLRALTNVFVSVYPIEILRDRIAQMKKRKQQFEEQIANVAGQKRVLSDTIAKNVKDGTRSLQMAEAAKGMAGKADPQSAEYLRFSLQMKQEAQHAGRLKDANVNYQGLLDKVTMVYDMLCKWNEHVGFFIDDTQDQVDQAEVQYKTMKAASGALSKAMAIVRGDSSDNDIYEQTMSYLAANASETLGKIDDFQRAITPFMDKIDVQNGAVQADALAALDKYEQKLLTEGDKSTQFLLPGNTADKVGVPVKRADSVESYFK